MKTTPASTWRRMARHMAMDAVAAISFCALACSASAQTLSARNIADCPIATTPYSGDTVLLDLLLNPSTRAVLEAEIPMVAHLPEQMLGTIPPTMAAIMSISRLASLGGATVDLEKLNRELSAIPVTPADSAARCARYDYERPSLPRRIGRPALLVFDKSNGFKDQPSVDAANVALQAMAAAQGWTIVTVGNAAVFNRRDLARFDAVIWNNVSGDVLTLSQRAALRRYIERGGGFAGIHGSGGDYTYDWDWYSSTLIGADFIGHPMWPQFQEARVNVDDPHAFITAGLPGHWTMTEEWYSFRSSPRATGAHVLLTLDESTYTSVGPSPPQNLTMGDHPIAWTRCIGDGRSFYTAIGHRPENYSEANSARVQMQGIAWAMGGGDTQCRDGREVARRVRR